MNPTLTRRGLLALTGAGALATAGCNGTAAQKASSQASASGSASALGQATVGLTYIPNIQFAPFYWAADKGLFSQHGADVTLRHHGASEALFTALAAGKEHYVIAGGDEAMQADSQGMDLVAVAGYYQKYPIAVIVPASSTITSLAGLKGKRIGIPGKYGETWFGLQLALHNAGLTTQDVTITTIGYTQVAALATKKVDAIVGFTNNDVVQFKASNIAVRTIAIGSDVPLVSSSIITTRAQLEKAPALTKAVCQAIVGGVQAVVADPAGAIATSVSHVPGLQQAAAQTSARATLDATLPLWKGSQDVPTLQLDLARFATMAAFMKSAGLVGTTVDASKAVDPSVLG